MKKTLRSLSLVLIIAIFTQIITPGAWAVNELPEKFDIGAQSAEISPIIGEVEELRDENTKHFICEDGSYVAVMYADPVHYEDNGAWKDIDNALKLSEKVRSAADKATYIPKAGASLVSIPQDLADGQKITMSHQGYTIGFGVSAENQNVSLQSAAELIAVDELISNTLLKNTASESSVTENINKSKREIIEEHNDEMTTLKNRSSAVTYDNVFPGADLEYILSSKGIKENIVVNTAQS